MNVYVFDANAVVSAALTLDGLARRAPAATSTRGFIALSDVVYGEVAEVLTRPKFSRSLTQGRMTEVLELLTAEALWVEPEEAVRDCRDP